MDVVHVNDVCCAVTPGVSNVIVDILNDKLQTKKNRKAVMVHGKRVNHR